MPTIFNGNVCLAQKVAFHTFAFAVNATEVGPWTASIITTTAACNLETGTMAKVGAQALACYFLPAAPIVTWLKSSEKAIVYAKEIYRASKWTYKAAKRFTSPIELVNYVGGQFLTRGGIIAGVKKLCGVKSSDEFYWEREEFKCFG